MSTNGKSRESTTYQTNDDGTSSEEDYDNSQFSDSSEDSDNYESILLSSLQALSKSSRNSSSDDETKPTTSRINFVKNLLGDNKLNSMVDFDNCTTETATSSKLSKKILNVKEIFSSMDVELKYLKSGTTGHTFKAISNKDPKVAFAVKVCAYPKDEYGGINNLSRPENAELRMLKLLSYFVINRMTPHFVLPIATFNTNILNFVNIPKKIVDPTNKKNELYKQFIDRYKEGEFEDFVSVLINEWCEGGDLLDYIRKNYKSMTLRIWKVIFFQILFSLAIVHQKYPSFKHNDMKANNILVDKTDNEKTPQSEYYRYNIPNNNVYFIIPNIKLRLKIWDFDFACIDGIIDNNKVNSDWTKKINITKKKNQYYDMHYFFNTLISERFFPQFYEKDIVPQEVIDFVHRIVPEEFRNGGKYVNKKGRIQVDTEYVTPFKVILNDPFFDKYRFKT